MCYSAMVAQSLATAQKRFEAAINQDAFDRFFALQEHESKMSSAECKEALQLARAPRSSQFKWALEQKHNRIYPCYFAPVIIWEERRRTIVPMRYRVRPHGSSEIPTKYNVFNARKDALLNRPTWRSIFGKNHCIFSFIKFYEWVERDGKKMEVSFSPENFDIMWAPAIYDSWQSPNGKISFSSFAIVTDDPPEEVAAAGHDRCPIFLKEQHIDQWLLAEKQSAQEHLNMLNETEDAYFSHRRLDK